MCNVTSSNATKLNVKQIINMHIMFRLLIVFSCTIKGNKNKYYKKRYHRLHIFVMYYGEEALLLQQNFERIY